MKDYLKIEGTSLGMEDDPIEIPASALLGTEDEYIFFIRGHLVNPRIQNMSVLLLHLARIRGIEGRYQGINMENGTFRFGLSSERTRNKFWIRVRDLLTIR